MKPHSDRDEPANPTTPSTNENDGRPDAESFPPFDDPAFSPNAPGPLGTDDPPNPGNQAEDTKFAGHPDFSQQAAKNKPPRSGVGNSERIEDAKENAVSDERIPRVPATPDR